MEKIVDRLTRYVDEKAGRKKIACRVQDDQGGESTWIDELEVR